MNDRVRKLGAGVCVVSWFSVNLGGCQVGLRVWQGILGGYGGEWFRFDYTGVCWCFFLEIRQGVGVLIGCVFYKSFDLRSSRLFVAMLFAFRLFICESQVGVWFLGFFDFMCFTWQEDGCFGIILYETVVQNFLVFI